MPVSKFYQKLSPKAKTALKVLRICGLVLLCVLLVGLLVNALLSVFMDGYYPTWGNKRLFAIVSDSMEPEIMTGNMIVSTKPVSEDEIQVGTVITYEYRQNNSKMLITHRVVAVNVNPDTGAKTFTTKGDNAAGIDPYRPAFDDVVGIFTGRQSGFWGYVFGFLQSAEGAIALILTVMIAVIAYVVVRFVNLVNTWRAIATMALKKSGALLSTTHNDDLVTIADVIGIITKDPRDKADQRRKDKKLNWFIRTGMLPKRPYSDDLDFDPDSFAGEGVTSIDLSAPEKVVEIPVPVLPQTEPWDGVERRKNPVVPQVVVQQPEPWDGVERRKNGGGKRSKEQIIEERHETMSYQYSCTARLIQLKNEAKEWYSLVKNAVLSYTGVRVRAGKKFESFYVGRKAVARLTVRGKTLCLLLALNAEDYSATKYSLETVNSTTPCLIKIKSVRKAKYACELIDDVMRIFNVAKFDGYEAQDFYMPYEGAVALMQKGLVKRNIKTATKVYRVEFVSNEDLDEEDRSDGEATQEDVIQATEQEAAASVSDDAPDKE